MPITSRSGVQLQDPLEVARRIAMDHPGGIAAIARKLGRHEKVLAHQLNPEAEGHHLGLATAIAITELTGDDGILCAWAALRGQVLVAVPAGAVGEEELLDDVLQLEENHGEFARVLRSARSDGVIDEREHQALVALLRKIMSQSATLERGVGAQVRQIPGRVAR